MAPEQEAIQNTIKLTHFPLLPRTNKPPVRLIQLLKVAYTQCISGKNTAAENRRKNRTR